MPHDHHQPRAELLGGKLDAANLRWRHDVARHADDKQVPKAEVKYDLRRHARIGATKNDGKRLLARFQFTAAFRIGERLHQLPAGHEPRITRPQALQCFR